MSSSAVARAGANRPKATLLVFDREGAKLGEMPLELWPWGLSVGPEVVPGRVAASSFRSPYLAEDTLVVDVAEGRVVDRLAGLRPAIGFWDGVGRPRRGQRDERARLP